MYISRHIYICIDMCIYVNKTKRLLLEIEAYFLCRCLRSKVIHSFIPQIFTERYHVTGEVLSRG